MARIDYITGRMSPELRLHICDFLFATSDHVKRRASRADPSTTAAILNTCRLIYLKTVEAFYDVRTIRLTITELYVAMQQDHFTKLARRVQIVEAFHIESPQALRSALGQTLRLPRVVEITLATDCVAENERMSHAGMFPPYVTVNEWANTMGLGEALCVGIGQYRLSDEFRRVELVHTKLLHLWQKVKTAPHDYDALKAGRNLLDRWSYNNQLPETNGWAWASQTSFRMWIDAGRARH